MNETEKAIITKYPYFSDGQFALEGIQSQLAKQYLASDKGKTGFYAVEQQAFVDLRLLAWDTDFFEKRVSRLVHFYFKNKEEGLVLWAECEEWLHSHKIEHVTFRVNEREIKVMELIKQQGFEQVNGKHLTRVDLEKQPAYAGDVDLSFAQAQITDAEVLMSLARGNFKENRFYTDDFFDNDKAGAVYESWINNKLKNRPEEIIKVSNGGKVIGFAMLSTLRPVAGKQFGFVELIAVDPAEAGQGYGKRITRYAMHHLAGLGNTVVFANVVNTNLPSLKMFHGVGFETYATLLEFRKLI